MKTKLYEKATDKHMYFHRKSDHYMKVKKAIPYGLGIRVKRICDDEYRKERKKIKSMMIKEEI